MSAAMTLAACGNMTQDTAKQSGELIGRSDIRIEGGRLTPEALWAMGRIGGISPSPDNKHIAYTVSYYSVPQNKSNTDIFVMNADGTDNVQLTSTPYSESQPTWIKNGQKLAYLSNESGTSQVWEMNPDGTDRHPLTNYADGIEGFAFSPDGQKLLFISQVKTVKSTADKYPDLPQASGIIVDDLMYKHWDEWVTTAPHPFVADFDGTGISNVRDLLEGEPYESPMKPFGGIEQLAWSTDSKSIAYTCRKKTGMDYALSTNSDIYIYNIETKEVRNITEGNKGYDTNPQYSPDGRYIAWQSMERDGYESDLNRLMVMDLQTGEKHFASRDFPSNVDTYAWADDSRSIYFTGVWQGTSQIYNTDMEHVYQLTAGLCDYASVAPCGNKLIATRHSMSQGDEIYAVEGLDSKPMPIVLFQTDSHARPNYSTDKEINSPYSVKQLTTENHHIYEQVEMGRVEGRRPAKRPQPILELPLELPDDGRQRLHRRSPLPSGHAGLRHGMERSHQRRLWRPVYERLTEGHR